MAMAARKHPFRPLDSVRFIGNLPNSDYGVFPAAGVVRTQSRGTARTGLIYETTIPTVKSPPQAAARIFGPELQPQRAGHPAQSPPRRAQTPYPGLSRHRPMAAETPERLRFGRGARLKQKRDFVRTRNEGERVVIGCLIANWRRLPPGSSTRLGVVTSGKIGGAVVRNRARRLLREAFRLHQHDLSGAMDLVLVARPSIAGKGLAEVEKDFLTMLRKTRLWNGAGEATT
jgi:ribonuclease P protein component